jgi:hypothetical protein
MIKFYAWEGPFRARVEDARANEAKTLKDMVWWQALFAMLLFSGPIAMAVFCFGSWALAGNVFAPASAYTALALFNLLRLPLAFLPMMVTALINALVALNRIGDFLQKPESGAAALEGAQASGEGVQVGAVKVGQDHGGARVNCRGRGGHEFGRRNAWGVRGCWHAPPIIPCRRNAAHRRAASMTSSAGTPMPAQPLTPDYRRRLCLGRGGRGALPARRQPGGPARQPDDGRRRRRQRQEQRAGRGHWPDGAHPGQCGGGGQRRVRGADGVDHQRQRAGAAAPPAACFGRSL